MSRLELTATVMSWALAGIVLVGCQDASQPGQSPRASSENHDPGVESPDDDVERSETYIACRATLTAFDKDYAWFDDSSVGHDDGVAPLASFVLVEPTTSADRALGILFKYTTDAAATSLPEQADVGSQFTFQIPVEVLKGAYKTIDNMDVRHFRKIEPEPLED